MVQSENLNDSVLAIHRATISRADLLRVWYSVEGNALDAAKWLAHELDFEYVPLQIEQPVESPDIDFPPEVPSQPEELPTRTDSIQTQRMAVESLWLPSEYLLAADFVSELEIEAPRLDGKLAWSKRPVALPPIALATWPEAKTRLSPIVEPPRRSPHIDVDKLVELISQGRLLKKLPTETIYRLERSIVVVEDRSARLFPYHRDQQWLIDSLKTHLPRGYFSHLTCCDPRSMVDPNRSFETRMRALTDQDLPSGCEFLVLSDLGILNSDWRLLGFWQEWIHERSRRDCRVSVMVPFPVDRVPSGFRDIAEFYSWQHSGVQSVLDREKRAQLVAEILSRLSPVSSFDPVLLRWIRQTVSGANDAALESFVWQDKSLDSNQYSSAKNDRVEAKQEYRKAFLDLDPKTKQWVLKLLRDSRAGLGEDPSLWFVELLSLDSKDVELIEDGQADMEDVRRAIRYLDENRGDAAVGGSITSFLKWFSSRVEADGVWSQDWGIGEVVRRWQREFQPKRALDRSTRISDFKGSMQQTPGLYWLKAIEGHLSIWKQASDQLIGGDSVLLRSNVRVLEVHGLEDRERAFWKSGVKPRWVSDYGTDEYGAWCEFQVPRHDGKGMVTQRMRWIKPGEFMMGSPDKEQERDSDETQHQVTLTQGYWMADSQVTQELWMAISGGENPSSFHGHTKPVENLSWKDCQAWISKLGLHHESLQISLPTEAQWEYACRAGSQAAYCFGDDPKELPKYGWFNGNSKSTTSPVKQLQPNNWGLYDMHGNVREWCSDWYSDFKKSAKSDPAGPAKGTDRVVRGGGWIDPARLLRSACRVRDDPGIRLNFLGFRLLSSAQGAEPSERAMLPVAEQGTEQASSIQVCVKDMEPSRSDLFWKSGSKPQWVSDYGRDNFGLWCELQVPRYDNKGLVTQRMRWIKPGTFLMGSTGKEKKLEVGDETQHQVTLTQGYWLADSQVTQELWESIGVENPGWFRRDSHPVEKISWSDCQEWLRKISKSIPTLELTLPTEAQWEYACRAGSTTAYCFGDDPKELPKYGWFDGNSKSTTHPVKQLQPNDWGLYDMHGNVWEWCSDWYHAYQKSATSDPTGPAMGTERVVRGGSWFLPARSLRSACRVGHAPGLRNDVLGFRLLSSAQVAEPSERAMLPVAELGTERARIGSAQPDYEFLRSVDLDATGENSPEEEFAEIEINAHTSIRVVSDQEGYQFDRLEKPSWAVDFGRDGFGPYAAIEVKAVRQRMRWIPPGKFLMGSPEGETGRVATREIQHEVILTRGFWFFDTPCRQDFWTAVMGDNPSYFLDPNRPVESLSWMDASRFCDQLKTKILQNNDHNTDSQPTNLSVRLPTEAEWEYACRARTNTATYAGNPEILGSARGTLLDSISWYGGNSGRGYDIHKSAPLVRKWLNDREFTETRGGTRKVGLKAPNPWGLFDMLGNVWEWCEDDFSENISIHRIDPIVRVPSKLRVFRGGSWISPARYIRAAYRYNHSPGPPPSAIGFRPAISEHPFSSRLTRN